MKRVPDFLPLPEQLIPRKNSEKKITIMLDADTIMFFKKQSKKLGSSYQRMIRNLLKDYVGKVSRASN